jgi:hypothetical protein
MEAFDLRKFISIDEQMIGFKGKLQISYKKEGDGFQCDTICCDGYTYSFLCETCLHQKVTSIRGYHHFMLDAYSCLTNSRTNTMYVEWITCKLLQNSFRRLMFPKTRSCAMELQGKVVEAFLNVSFKKGQRVSQCKIE